MSFGDLSEKFKRKQAGKAAAQVADQTSFEEIHAIRARMLGVLLRDARTARGTTQQESASELGVTEDEVRDWEYGRLSPSLPQLEMLAYYYDVPLSHFWSDKTLAKAQEERNVPLPKEQYPAIRNKMIAAMLIMARSEARLSVEQVAAAAGLTAEQVQGYERGEPVSFPVLTALASAVKKNLTYFLEGSGRIGSWLTMQEEYRRFGELAPEIRAFVSQPVNEPYLEVAMRLASLPRGELRNIAERILDITL